jgi:tetratricopeptide (TPR) repeat protein
VYLKAVSQWCCEPYIHAVVILPVAKSDYKSAFRQSVLPHSSVEDKLICCYLHTFRTRGNLIKQEDSLFTIPLLIRQDVRRNDEGFVAAGLNEQGAKLLGEGRYAEAAGLFSEALVKNPDFAYAYHNRGIAYGKMKDYGRAVADFSSAIALNANYATAYGGRGFALYSMGDHERAIADLRRAVALKPDYADAFYIIGNAYMQLGHYEEALRDYEKALALNPSLGEARKNRDMLANAMQN